MVQQDLKFPETFWDGRREEEVADVDKYIPISGACSTPKMDKWRKYQNMYYRLFNDGDKPNYFSMSSLAKSVGMQWKGLYLVPNGKRVLEEIGDRLLDNALEEIKSGVAPLVRGVKND